MWFFSTCLENENTTKTNIFEDELQICFLWISHVCSFCPSCTAITIIMFVHKWWWTYSTICCSFYLWHWSKILSIKRFMLGLLVGHGMSVVKEETTNVINLCDAINADKALISNDMYGKLVLTTLQEYWRPMQGNCLLIVIPRRKLQM